MSDGKEYFKAGIDLDQFEKDAKRIKNSFSDIGRNAELEGAKIDSSLRKVGVAVASIFTIQKATQFAGDIARVRGEFQQLEIAFETMLGSKSKSDALMGQLINTAAKTPFDLQGVANGAKQLLAYGTASEKVNDTLIQLGDIASGLNIPLNDLVYLYGTSQVQGRLFTKDIYQFMGRGIPIIGELSKILNVTEDSVMDLVTAGKVGFPELQQVIDNLTKSGGMFSGLMEKQSASITGQIANFEDAVEVALNNIGKNSEGAFSTAIDTATLLVENYETVGKILGALIVTYGTYKAAIIAVNTVQSLQSKIALETALAGRQLTISQGLQAVATKGLSRAQGALNKTMLANPYVLATMALVGLGYATYKVITHQNESEKAQRRLNDAFKESQTGVISESRELARLKGELSAATKGTDEYNAIKDKIVKGYGKYYDGLEQEIDKVGLLEKTYTKLTEAITKSFGARQYESFIQSEQKNLDELMSKNLGKIQDRLYEGLGDEVGANVYSKIRKAIIEGTEITADVKEALDKVQGKGTVFADSRVDGYIEKIKEAQKVLDETDKKAKEKFGIEDTPTKADEPTPIVKTTEDLKKQTEQARSEVTKLKKELDELLKGTAPSANYAKDIEDKTKDLKSAEDRLSYMLTGKPYSDPTKSTSEIDKKRKEAQDKADLDQKIKNSNIKTALDERGLYLDNQHKKISLMTDGFDKEQQLIENNHKKELLSIQKRAQELIEQQQQAEKDLWEQNGSKGVFKATTTTIEALPTNYQSQLIEAENIANNQRIHSLEEVNTRLLARYQDYATRKLEVEKQFDEDLKALNAIPESNAKNAAIAQLEKDRKEAIKSISEEESAELVNTTDLFVRLFTEASEQSVRQVKGVISEVQELYEYLTKTKTEDISDNFGFTADQLKTFKGDATQLKAILDGLNSKKKELGDKSPFEAFKVGMSEGLKKIKSGDADSLDAGVSQIGKSVQEFLPSVQEFGENFGAMFDGATGDSIDGAMKMLDAVGGVAEGFAKGGIVGGIAAVANEGMKMFTASKQIDKEHKEALRRLDQERLSQQRQYNLLLMEQNMLLKEATSAFGTDEIRKAANYIDVYKHAIKDLNNEIKGDKPEQRRRLFGLTDSNYRQELKDYNAGIGKLAKAEIVDGSRKSGWGPWKKRKDVYKSVLDVYPELITAEGDLDKALLETILSTRKMSDETRAYLENLKALTEQAEEAKEALKDYIASTFGELGTGAITSIVDSIKEGTNAWREFGKVGASVIEKLGEQLAYELFFSNKFKKLQDDLEKVYSSGKSSDKIAKDAMDIVGSFYDNIGTDMNAAQDWMNNWKKEAEKAGLDLWQSEDKLNQSSSRGMSVAATQDQMGEVNGRITYMQFELVDISKNVNNMMILDTERNNLMRSYAVQFDEIRNMSIQALFYIEDISKDTKYLSKINDGIEDLKKEIKGL